MNYDPYFEADVCGKCGAMIRKKSKETSNLISQQSKAIEHVKRVMLTMAAH
jgi:hypothetical protein